MTAEEYRQQETMKLIVKSYDKGINDAFDTLKAGLVNLKEKGVNPVFRVDDVIRMIELCKIEGNKIPTTYE